MSDAEAERNVAAAAEPARSAQAVPDLVQRRRIARGLITRLEDPLRTNEAELREEELRDYVVAELLVPTAVEALTFAIVRSERPPDHEPVDLARLAICQRVLNALPTSHGLIRYHLYVEAIEASRPLLECALLLEYFLTFPDRARDWFEHPERFRSPAGLREQLGRKRFDPFYGWSSEHGDHVTARAFQLIADLSDDGRLGLSIGGRYDETLQRLTSAVVLMSSAAASQAIVSTWMHDLERMPRRGARAFFQLARSGELDLPSVNALGYVRKYQGTDGSDDLEKELRELQEAYRKEAATLEAAGLAIPAEDAEF